MRRIKFDEDTVQAIRSYIQEGQHSMEEACNHFTLKYDTLKRVMRENEIQPYYINSRNANYSASVDGNIQHLICQLFLQTDTPLRQICKECSVEYYQLQQVLNAHFSKKQQDDRKSRLYRNSKLGNNNPMKMRTGRSHPNYIGIVSDGNGYLQCKKPDWYTGRVKSDYVFVHHVVICEALGITEIPKGFVVHHIDGNKHNNSVSNLALMSMSGHSKLHGLQRKLILEGAETIR